MKKIIVVICSLFISNQIYAADILSLPVACADAKIVENLMMDYNEVALSGGISNRETKDNKMHSSLSLLFANVQTGTWTLIEKLDANTYCIIATGTNFREFKKGNMY